jgi:hypothetical protein
MRNDMVCEEHCCATLLYDVSGVAQCVECPNIDLCHFCFCAGVELKQHSKSHKYRVNDSLQNFSVFSADWSARDELRLIEGTHKSQ